MALTFEWDDEKSRENIRKHGVAFDEARTVFNDPLAMTISDPEHSSQEDRYNRHGHVFTGAHPYGMVYGARTEYPHHRLTEGDPKPEVAV